MFHDRHSSADDGSPSEPASRPPAPLATVGRGDPRGRILRAMIETVARMGYDLTTVSRVLAGANVEEAVFSEHFDDKRDCFMQAVDELIGRAERAAVERFARPTPWPERVRMGLRDLLEGLAHDPDGARVAFVEMLSAGPAAAERHRSALELFASLMEEGRSQAVDPGCLPPQTSEAIVGGIASIVHRRVLQGEVAGLPSLHGDLTYFALLPYLGEDAT